MTQGESGPSESADDDQHRADHSVPTPPAPAGGVDVVAIRRVWPEVLGRVFTMRRVTWTFLSQHAQVIDYDGTRLVLGIATTGLANTFRQGNHAELVRQAVLDEIGLDVRVEGVPMPEAGSVRRSGTSLPTTTPVGSGRDRTADGGPGRDRPADGGLDPGSPALPAAQPPAGPAAPSAAAEHSSTGLAHPEPAQEGSASLDDEDVAAGAEVGRAVIERMLGAQVLAEFDE